MPEQKSPAVAWLSILLSGRKQLHDVHCLYKGSRLERKDKRKPGPMGVNSKDQRCGSSKKQQPPHAPEFLGLFHL